MIKQKYEWIEGEGPFMINSDEHNNVQYKDKSQTKEGRMMAYFAKTILENGIKIRCNKMGLLFLYHQLKVWY